MAINHQVSGSKTKGGKMPEQQTDPQFGHDKDFHLATTAQFHLSLASSITSRGKLWSLMKQPSTCRYDGSQ